MSEADRPHATSEADRPRAAAEPRLATRSRERRRRRLPLHVAIALPLALTGLIALLVTGNALRPFDRVITIHARMASKSDYFKDPEVQRLLLKHGIRVDIKRLGSRGIATQSLEGMDVVFPSGQPAAKLILNRQKQSVDSARPFVTPLVLGTFQQYAETLVKAGVATAQPTTDGRGDTLYYDLNMARFMDLLDGLHKGRVLAHQDRDKLKERADTWNGIGFDKTGNGRSNGNRVLVRTSDVCESNSAGSYLSILAFVANGDSTPGADENDKDAIKEAEEVARKIKPLITLQGMWDDEQADSYFSDVGDTVPIALIYEHQYLAHQIDHVRKHNQPDPRRVLLYPSPSALTKPQLISLSEKGDRLVELIKEDRDLRRRAIELGFRVRVSGEDGTGKQLDTYLREHGIQAPVDNPDQTAMYEPDLEVLERIIDDVGGCSPPERDTP
ncbi:hypothetical protein QQY66_13815 [Streptomyces sp. DG2A-72]|uniref:hypothetical protein n=1 Tax=Streptomyces sp. DG2A-72 TaxID=3051386 RepID=UPI00265C549C|nr:hypothetical protein [Streptomyces sp. DG2A-72]MDO0932716.1 hypothetical protein [Streptomyces sp. DG2A-72]